MRIHELHVDRFGVWQDLRLPLTQSGITVFYGPNEAGKSTLMRFIRGMIYGYRPQDERTAGPNPQPVRCSGALKLEQGGKNYILKRVTQPGTRGKISVDGSEDATKTEGLLKTFTGGTTEPLFENVFAIGLQELQELATLDGEDVARHIYGISLGPDGERILRAQFATERDGKLLADPESHEGELFELARNLQSVEKEMASVGDPSKRHAELSEQRDELDREIERLKRKQADSERNIRGYTFMDRVHGPWLRERQLRLEIGTLPNLASFPKDGLKKVDDFDRDIEQLEVQRRRLAEEITTLDDQYGSRPQDTLMDGHLNAIRQLLDEQREIREIERRLGERRGNQDGVRKRLDDDMAALRGNFGDSLTGTWDISHLERADVTPAALLRMVDCSREYTAGLAGRARTLKQYKQRVAKVERDQAGIEDRLRNFGGLTLTQARQHAYRRLEELDELSRLQVQEEQLEQILASIAHQEKEVNRPTPLPLYYYATLWFFTIAGLILFLAGLYAVLVGDDRLDAYGFGGHGAWIAGAVYMLLGVCCTSVTWTMHEHIESLQANPNSLKSRRYDLQRQLEEIRGRIDEIMRQDQSRGPLPTVAAFNSPSRGLLKKGSDPSSQSSDEESQTAERVRPLFQQRRERNYFNDVEVSGEQLTEHVVQAEIRQRLLDYDELEREAQRIEDRRLRLSEMRQAIRDRQRRVSTARKDWCELLRKLGLKETLKVKDAFTLWHKVAEARELWNDWHSADKLAERDHQFISDFRSRVDSLARRLPVKDKNVSDHHQLLLYWDHQLQSLTESQQERVRLQRELEERRRRLLDLDTKLDDRRNQRLALLDKAGASDRADLAARLGSFKRVEELQRLHKAAQEEVTSAARSDTELAIVEDDLLAFDTGRNQRNLDQFRQESKTADAALQQCYEKLGRVKQELTELENDRRITSLRFDKAQIQDQLQRSTERWFALQLASQAVEKIRGRVERNHQPDIIKHASAHLDRLTCGKYANIWTPLGQRHLVVDDDKGESLKVEHLSNGTREQVFLAIRMAMVKDFSDRGVELPMVLDDVVVNFDQVRTEAAVQALQEFADQGQQILIFTCHLHLAHLFESQGIEPIWLPTRAGVREGNPVGS